MHVAMLAQNTEAIVYITKPASVASLSSIDQVWHHYSLNQSGESLLPHFV